MPFAITADISDLLGKVILKITGGQDTDELTFLTFDGAFYKMYHDQDCCEKVNLEEVVGDLDDLLFHPLLVAEEVSSDDPPPASASSYEYAPESYTWTFYKLGTIKGSVTLRWFGSSNGYYSERVNFERIKAAD